MLLGQRSHPTPLTQDDWLRLLTQYRRRDWSWRHPRERRTGPRQEICAFVTLTLQSPEGGAEHTVYSRCLVLDVSPDGLSVRVYRKIALGAVLSIDVNAADKRFALTGRVTHSSGFPGNYRLGLRLEFAETGGPETGPCD